MSASAAISEPKVRAFEIRNLWKDAYHRFARNKLSLVSAILALGLILVAIFAGVLAPEGYDNQIYSEAWQAPSAEHWLGTDAFGRDVLTRIMYGARISLTVAIVVNLLALAIGMPLGLAAGWFGGKIDFALMRIVDVMSAFPTLLFAILLMSVLGSGLVNIFIALAVTRWISVARLVRGQVLSLREQDYAMAARSIGATDFQIMRWHMLPNTLAPLLVNLTLGIPDAILGEASLSFLGVGVNAPMPSWGKMLNEHLPYLQSYGYLSIFPALAIALTMYSFTLLGDGLRDALDPQSTE